MRIIDADALIEDIIGDLTDGIAEGRAIEKIDNAPTVDAIPVEWIKENKNLARAVGVEQYELFLDTLLSDWEEERKEK